MTTTFPDISISTERLVLRPFDEDDIPALAEMMNDEQVTAWTDVPQPYTEDATPRAGSPQDAPAERTEGRGIVFAVTEFLTQRLVGIVQLQSTNWRIRATEVGYITAPWARGEGYATESALAVAQWLFRDQKFERIELRTAADNTASQQVAQKIGCISEGVLRNACIARARHRRTAPGPTSAPTSSCGACCPRTSTGPANNWPTRTASRRTPTGTDRRRERLRGPPTATRRRSPCTAHGAPGFPADACAHPQETDDDGRPGHGDRLGRLAPDRRGPLRALAPPRWWPAPPTTSHSPKCRPPPNASASAASTSPPAGSPATAAPPSSSPTATPASSASYATLRAPEHGLEVEVVPAVSSVAAAFARAGMPWDDAQVVVAHRRTLRRAVNVCRAHPKVAVLTSPGAGPAELAPAARRRPPHLRHLRGTGHRPEQVTVLTSDKAADHTWRDPNVVIVIGGHGRAPPDAGGWIRRARPRASRPRGWTPARRRPTAAGMRRRRVARRCAPPNWPASDPRTGDLVWDIGCGSGAFAVEAAAASAPPSSPSTATGTPATAPTPPPAASASSSRSSTAPPRTYWRSCPSPTWSGSAAGERPWSPRVRRPPPASASSPTPPPGTRPKPSAGL